jgi:hypothetical protein
MLLRRVAAVATVAVATVAAAMAEAVMAVARIFVAAAMVAGISVVDATSVADRWRDRASAAIVLSPSTPSDPAR